MYCCCLHNKVIPAILNNKMWVWLVKLQTWRLCCPSLMDPEPLNNTNIRINQKLLTHKTLTECVCADADEPLKWASSGRHRDCRAPDSLSFLCFLRTLLTVLWNISLCVFTGPHMMRRREENVTQLTDMNSVSVSRFTACNLTHNVESIYSSLTSSLLCLWSVFLTAGSQLVITVNITYVVLSLKFLYFYFSKIYSF